jgi:hypothetical protein
MYVGELHNKIFSRNFTTKQKFEISFYHEKLSALYQHIGILYLFLLISCNTYHQFATAKKLSSSLQLIQSTN